jgi:hypothetical protein
MARLPIPRKQPPPSKPAQALQRVARVWMALKLASAGARAARRSAKAAGAAKGAAKSNKGKATLFVIPAAVAGGYIVWRKTRSDSNGRETDFDRPLGPVATADTVSPPETSSPASTPPETSSPATTPPETSSPATTPPETSSPATTPPETSSPGATPPETSTTPQS